MDQATKEHDDIQMKVALIRQADKLNGMMNVADASFKFGRT